MLLSSMYTIIDIHLCETTDHVNAIFRIGPLVTYVVITGDLVPAVAMLVTRSKLKCNT